jgi:hypothetical protein
MFIRDFHQSFIVIFILFAPASREFSTNSLTTDAGLSTISQALSLFIRYSGSLRIGINFNLNCKMINTSFLLDLVQLFFIKFT